MQLPVLKSAFSTINNLLYKSYIPNILKSAIEIGIFDALSGKAMSCNELVAAINTDYRVTESCLAVLVAADLLNKSGEKYSLTPLSDDYLVKSSPASQVYAVCEFATSDGPFKGLTEALKGNIPSFKDRMWSSEDAIRGIEQGAKAGSLQNAVAFVKDIPEFQQATKMCDFAGNSGYYAYAFMNENEQLHAHVYDLPDVCTVARELKKEEEHFNRITYHNFNIKEGDSFGDSYDFFFSSHYLYHFAGLGTLNEILKEINRSMKLGGLFVSNHMDGALIGDDLLTMSVIELMTRSMGFPTHCIPEEVLKEALTNAGFGEFTLRRPDQNIAYATLLLSAIKVTDIKL
ncbi:methyltransferase domain-containing protein [Puteibacter caeruleilacunae]|nr:methyltransferase domain-containing protein [Puteibacter caeruleilacunae]